MHPGAGLAARGAWRACTRMRSAGGGGYMQVYDAWGGVHAHV